MILDCLHTLNVNSTIVTIIINPLSTYKDKKACNNFIYKHGSLRILYKAFVIDDRQDSNQIREFPKIFGYMFLYVFLYFKV